MPVTRQARKGEGFVDETYAGFHIATYEGFEP